LVLVVQTQVAIYLGQAGHLYLTPQVLPHLPDVLLQLVAVAVVEVVGLADPEQVAVRVAVLVVPTLILLLVLAGLEPLVKVTLVQPQMRGVAVVVLVAEVGALER
jgi:hypothetical protein